MKLAALCCTYNRPELLPGVVRMFEFQTHPDRELIILDDAGQYYPQEGDHWRLYSMAQRFASFGAKRNHCASLVSDDVDGLVIWDDDDCYLPWHMAACAEALEQEPWARPTLVIDNSTEWGDRGPVLGDTYRRGMASQYGDRAILYHGAWAFRREAFRQTGGYPETAAGDLDSVLGEQLANRFGPGADTISHCYPEPSYVYCFGRPVVRVCNFEHWQSVGGVATEADLAKWGEPKHVGVLKTRWPEGYCRLPADLPRVASAERAAWQHKG